ncbi:allantoinase AllB [Isoptericola sp. BMS4]|uniref:allantoinase AllB n=1 Tax=Isoptericola sp. BMS4 TaxID=2527875 RepID=UPI001420B848|nr:allantoinase AllB [Isoptericola sp. BMS4]
MTTAPTSRTTESAVPRATVPGEVRHDLVLRAARAVTPEGERAVEVGVTDGRVAAVVPLGTGLVGDEVHELAADEVLLPGLVDSHVHVNEPGRTQWEGFATATRAAAAGGVTTIVDMPLNSVPPTTTVANLETKQRRAADQAFVDVGFWGGAVPGSTGDLRPLHEAGVFGFKCFLADSGVPEFGHLDDDELRLDLAELRTFDGLMIVHAEDPDALSSAPHEPGRHYRDFLASRPAGAESAAIAAVIDAARATGARAHVLHLSDAGSLPQIAAARAEGVRLTVETCPHYLSLDAEHVPDGATAYKCCPPIREQGNQDGLWQGLADGTIDIVVTDHSPATAELKEPADGDFATAWGGVSSLQLGLAVVWSEARRRGVALEQVVRWMSEGPARLVGLEDKGAIAVGKDADLVVFAPDEAFVVDPRRLHHKNPVTPYAGRDLTGVARRTLLRGRPVGDRPTGRLLRHAGAPAPADRPSDHPAGA